MACGSDGGRDPILGIDSDVISAAPIVIAVTPEAGATDVALDSNVTATFSEPVQALIAADLTVTCEAPCVNPTGTVALNPAGTVATFTPSPGTLLRPLTEYTGTVSGATSIATGLTMEAPFTWSFTTTATPPVVISVAPADNTTGVAVNNTVISAEFNEPVVALTGVNFTVTCEAPCTSPTGTILMNATSRVATFVADAALEPQTQYTATVVDAESIASGLTLVNPFVWRFTTGQTPDTTRPRVTITVPATTDPGPTTDVPTNTAITAVFTEDMDPLTIDGNSFTLTCAAPCVSPDGVVSYSVGSAIATFEPDPPGTLLEEGTTYTATITDAATDLAGNQLAGNQDPLPDSSDYVWSFTTTTAPLVMPPAVTSVAPTNNATDVALNRNVTVTFSEPVQALIAANFTVTCEAPCTNPTGTISMNPAGTVATFTPTPGTLLRPLTEYTGTVSGATSIATGLTMEAPFTWSFTTTAAPPVVISVAPVNNATGVAINNTVISAEFNEPVVALVGANFTVTCEAPCTSPTGTISMNSTSRVATFVADAALEPQTQYTATVSDAESIASGQTMVNPFVWSFTTIAAPPVVISVAPVNNATGVAVNNTVISAEFNEPVVALVGANFTVTCEAPCTSPTGTISMNSTSRVATFVADAALEPQTQYTATVSDAESIASGQTLVNPFVWRFTTGLTPDTTRPRVTLTVPATTDPGPTTDVPTNTAITAAFTEDMDPLTIDDTSFTLTCAAPCVSPAGVVSYSVSSAIATFKPDPPGTLLEDNTTYTATITDAATDLAGNQLAGNQAPLPDSSDYVWTFTTSVAVGPDPVTVVDTSPVVGDIDVCPNASISAIFDAPSGQRMDPDSLTPLTFLLVEVDPGSTVVDAASVTLDQATGLTATFKPLDLLVTGTTYRATIVSGENGVKDLAIPANELENDFSWEFTVGPDSNACLDQIQLGLATPFAIAATTGLTNTATAPITTINGDVVLDPNFTCNAVPVPNDGTFGLCGGSPPTLNGQVITDTFPDTTTSGLVKDDLNAAFLSITPSAGPPATGSLDGGTPIPSPTTLGAATGSALVFLENYFTPGVYTSSTSILISNDILLDAQGNPDAVFVFQSESTLTTADGAASPGVHTRILLTGGAKASNVWWQVSSSATIGNHTEFNGNVLAAVSITLKIGATSCGRMMAGAWVGGSGAIVLDSNLVSVPGNGCP